MLHGMRPSVRHEGESILTPTVERFKAELAQLPEQDRAELVEFLVQSLDETSGEDVTDAWHLELGRRWNDVVSGNSRGVPAEDVIARLREQYP